MPKSERIKKKFDALYAKWQKVIRDPKIQMSSRPKDYTDNEPYREIVKLGKDALPLVVEKMEKGVFLMNQAALEISGLDLDKLVAKEKKQPAKKREAFLAKKPPKFLSENQKSKLIAKYARLSVK